MDTTKHAEAWRENVRSKAKEIQRDLTHFFALLPDSTNPKTKPLFDQTLITLAAKCGSMFDLFGSGMAPTEVQELSDCIKYWKGNRSDSVRLLQMAQLHERIGKLDGSQEPDELSFLRIIETHRKDATLLQCLDELMVALAQILEEGDDLLKSQAAKELERILGELKKRKDQSIFDLQPWVEFSLVTSVAIIDCFTGTPLATIAVAAVTAAKKSQVRLRELFTKAYDEYVESLKLRVYGKFRNALQEHVIDATVEQVMQLLENQDELKRVTGKERPSILPPNVENSK